MADIEFLIQQGEQLFGKRSSLLSLWQELADNFYPERADFTTVRNVGEEFAQDLSSSYPLMVRRDLGNALGAMLRPTSKSWKHLRTKGNWEKLGSEGRAWLEWADARMTRAMQHRTAQFSRATKEADHDFATFGQAVLQVSLNRQGNGMLYRTWHLRDVAWVEDENGSVCTIYRKWKPALHVLKRLFPKTLHPEYQKRVEKEPYLEVEVWHVVVPSDQCSDKKYRTPYVSFYLDVANKHSMEDVGQFDTGYLIPRWQTVSGSQYAYSPATVAGLPDARLLQAMTFVLLDAGEMAVRPPMIAVQEAIRADISLYAGGITYVDAQYDERLGEVLRPITQETRGIPLGIDMARGLQAMLAEAFFLNKLSLPQSGQEMTAYETGQRVQEYIRQALPLFEPLENEYNAPLCELTFERMLRAGAFGSPLDMPKELRGQDVEFTFESPLHDAVEREKGQRFLEAGNMLAQAMQLDPSTRHVVDIKTAFRDVLNGIGIPAKWTRTEEKVDQLTEADEQAQQQQAQLANLQQGAEIAEKVVGLRSEAGAAAGEEVVSPADTELAA